VAVNYIDPDGDLCTKDSWTWAEWSYAPFYCTGATVRGAIDDAASNVNETARELAAGVERKADELTKGIRDAADDMREDLEDLVEKAGDSALKAGQGAGAAFGPLALLGALAGAAIYAVSR